MIDLTGTYNALLQRPLHESGDHGPSLSALKPGRYKLQGKDYEIRGIIQPQGSELRTQRPDYPVAVKGISVGRSCKALRFLGGCGWSVEEGVQVGPYVVRYDNGQETVIPIRYGKDVRDWFIRPARAREPAGPSHAWQGDSGGVPVPDEAQRVRIYVQAWTNPEPGKSLASIDFISAITDSAAFLLAITAEE